MGRINKKTGNLEVQDPDAKEPPPGGKGIAINLHRKVCVGSVKL